MIDGLDIEAAEDGMYLLIEGDFAEQYEDYLGSALPHLRIALNLREEEMRDFISKLRRYYDF